MQQPPKCVSARRAGAGLRPTRLACCAPLTTNASAATLHQTVRGFARTRPLRRYACRSRSAHSRAEALRKGTHGSGSIAILAKISIPGLPDCAPGHDRAELRQDREHFVASPMAAIPPLLIPILTIAAYAIMFNMCI